MEGHPPTHTPRRSKRRTPPPLLALANALGATLQRERAAASLASLVGALKVERKACCACRPARAPPGLYRRALVVCRPFI